MAIYDLVDRPDLKYPPFTPSIPKQLVAKEDMFSAMRDGELLLHHPFESFAPVIDFLRQAAADPDVLAIKQTLYRAGPQSPVVDALVDAARAGKEVTVIIELMARFDEAANIHWPLVCRKPAHTSCTESSDTRRMRSSSWSCAANTANCGATVIAAPATIIPIRRGSIRTTGCSHATKRWARTCMSCSCS